MLNDERRNFSPTGGHVQSNRAKSRQAHEDQSVGPDLVEDFLGSAEFVPVVAWLLRVRALLLHFAQVKQVVEVELTIELLEWGNPSASIVPPT